MYKSFSKICASAACLLFVFFPAVACGEIDWHPRSTWVFAVGVLEWKNSDVWPNMPSAQVNRRDELLVKHFQSSGIANDRIVFLKDQHATGQRIQQELVTLLKRTQPGDVLVFYFAGHGFRDHKSHEVHFANYDAVDGKTAWRVRSIFDTLESHFQGSRAVLMADCCYSGGLVDEARLRKTHLGYACLCSSFSHNSSTGRWTFTDSLLAGLRGNPMVDMNNDGEIAVSELGQYSELEMAFIEKQKSVYDNNPHFPAQWRISHPAKSRLARQGERLEVEWKGKWYRARVLEASGDHCKIHYVGFADSWDEWVGPDRMRPFEPKHLPEGSPVEVRWSSDKKWYPATVVRSWYGLTFVHYTGYPNEWDEWVNFDAIRPVSR